MFKMGALHPVLEWFNSLVAFGTDNPKIAFGNLEAGSVNQGSTALPSSMPIKASFMANTPSVVSHWVNRR